LPPRTVGQSRRVIRNTIYTGEPLAMMDVPPNTPTCRNADNSKQRDNTMGDRSPKSNQKKSNQKQTKNNAADQKKKQAVASKQAAGQKK
jgi:hypothetical protein